MLVRSHVTVGELSREDFLGRLSQAMTTARNRRIGRRIEHRQFEFEEKERLVILRGVCRFCYVCGFWVPRCSSLGVTAEIRVICRNPYPWTAGPDGCPVCCTMLDDE